MVHPPRPVDYLALIVNVLLLTAVFLSLRAAAARVLGKRGWRFAQMAFVASLAVPINGLREILSQQFPYLKSPLIDLIGVRGVWALVFVIAAGAAIAILFYHRRLSHGAVAVLTVLSPFCAITFGQASHSSVRRIGPSSSAFFTGTAGGGSGRSSSSTGVSATPISDIAAPARDQPKRDHAANQCVGRFYSAAPGCS
jgi:hypothetical protein